MSWAKLLKGYIKEVRVTHILDLTVRYPRGGPEGAGVVIKEKNGDVVFEGRTGADGRLVATLVERSIRTTGTTVLMPHAVSMAPDGRTAGKTVTLDASKQETLVVE